MLTYQTYARHLPLSSLYLTAILIKQYDVEGYEKILIESENEWNLFN